MKKIIIIIALISLACQSTKNSITIQAKDDNLNEIPVNLWLSEKAKTRVDSVFSLAKQAHIQLNNTDTTGAELTYEYVYETVARFSTEEQNTLSRWSKYDSVLQLMNDDYEKIFSQEEEITEAEEIREDIVDLEETLFPDSLLFSDQTVIDSSGGMPITLNKKVRAAIKYFQTKGRAVFTKWYERSGRYENLITEIFSEYEIPKDLIYLAMIESGFNPSARSYARAVGMWQFISATGKFYGLRHNWWFDERRDYVKSTIAAAQHLRDLNQRFDGDWYLSLAGYNCNPKRVEKNMRIYNTKDYWKLRRLPRQTRNYVPTFLAARILANDPQKFGFYVDKLKPIEVDSVHISESVDLNVIAKIVDTTYAYIKEINPAILQWVTPPGIKDFALYIPKDKKEQFKTAYAAIPNKDKRSWVRHKIKNGETLSTIAGKYHTNISVLRSVNKLKSNLIRAGEFLLIPVPQNKEHYYANISKPTVNKKNTKNQKKSFAKENLAEYKAISYIVKKGDTLGEIAEKYSTRASKIRSWNGLYYGEHIFPRQKLTLYVPKNQNTFSVAKKDKKPSSDNSIYYTVRRGDTLWDISKKYGISIAEIKKINQMNSTKIKPGDRIRVQSY